MPKCSFCLTLRIPLTKVKSSSLVYMVMSVTFKIDNISVGQLFMYIIGKKLDVNQNKQLYGLTHFRAFEQLNKEFAY